MLYGVEQTSAHSAVRTTATTDIRNLPQVETSRVNVYSIEGRLLRANVQQDEALTGLPKGIYIVGTMKYVVR